MSDIRIEHLDGVTVVHMERRPVNAMSPAFLDEGLEAISQLVKDPPGAVVINGLPGVFSAGLDLKVAPTLTAETADKFRLSIENVFRGWYGFSRPVVAAVTGHAIAGGLILALCADWRVVGRAGQFGLTEIKAGVPYPGTARQIVEAELAPPDARRLMLRANLIDAAEATRIGVFDEQVADDEVLDRAIAMARELATLPASAYAATKAASRAPVLQPPITAPDEWMSAATPDAAASLLRSGKAGESG